MSPRSRAPLTTSEGATSWCSVPARRGTSLADATVDDYRWALELNYLGMIRVF